MMEAARTSETLVNFYQTTRCYNPEDSNLHELIILQIRLSDYRNKRVVERMGENRTQREFSIMVHEEKINVGKPIKTTINRKTF
jgi:tRNA A-37 threonylcarbamoyl transferase component Bud32